ncbi:MAG: universal stress protein [Bacteroidota bacterium]
MKKRKLMLCPVDFSPASYETVEKASFLARLFQAELTLLHVIQVLPRSFGVLQEADMDAQAVLDNARTQARTLLRAAKQRYIPYVVPSKSVVRSGNWTNEILQEIRHLGADLLILPAKGAVFSRDLDRMVREATCPILAYQHHGGENTPIRKGFRKILVPVYDDPRSEDLLGYMTRYLSMMSPEVILVDMESDTPEANVVLLRYEAALLDAGIRTAKKHVISGQYPEMELRKLALAEACDLILMAPEGNAKRGLERQSWHLGGEIPVLAWGPSRGR